MDVSNINHMFATEQGRTIPLSFVYDGRAYYFDQDSIFDDQSTISTDFNGDNVVSGLTANHELTTAIKAYGNDRGAVWIAPDFRDAVAYILDDMAR